MENETNESATKLSKLKAELKENRTLKPTFEIAFNEIKFGEKINDGGFGIVFKGKWRENKVAIKTLKDEHHKEATIKDFLNECNAL